MRYLGIVVGDIKSSYGVIRELKNRSIPFILLREGEPVPGYVSAVILCGAVAASSYEKAIHCDASPRRTVLRALSAAAGRERFRLVVVGLDPGESTGIAVIGDGELLEAYAVQSSDLEGELDKIFGTYDAEKFLFRVGTGRKSDRALERIKMDPRASVELVPESRTGLPHAFRRRGLKRDVKSALIIALTAYSKGEES
jgi:hypothetical protein